MDPTNSAPESSTDHVTEQSSREAESETRPTPEGRSADKRRTPVVPFEPVLSEWGTFCFVDIEPEEQDWLWRGRVPNGELTAILGPRGVGKSFVALDMAVRVAGGMSWPDAPEQRVTAGSVLVIASEDHYARVIRPRLKTSKANLAKIHAIQVHRPGEPSYKDFTLGDLKRLERAADGLPDLRLIIVDTFAALLGSDNDWRTGGALKVLEALREFAARRQVAIVLVNATDKVSAGRMGGYTTDVLPFVQAVARSVWTVEPNLGDPDYRHFAPGRTNLAETPTGLLFKIAPNGGPIEWNWEPLALPAESAEPTPRESSAVAKATRWLREYLADMKQRAVDVLREGMIAGHSRRAIYAAKTRIGIKSHKSSNSDRGQWWWDLPLRELDDESLPKKPKAKAKEARREDSKMTVHTNVGSFRDHDALMAWLREIGAACVQGPASVAVREDVEEWRRDDEKWKMENGKSKSEDEESKMEDIEKWKREDEDSKIPEVARVDLAGGGEGPPVCEGACTCAAGEGSCRETVSAPGGV